MKRKNFEIVERYVSALKNKDLSLAPLADDLKFENPLTGKGEGAENFIAFLTGFLNAIKDVRIRRFVSEDNTVVAYWEIESEFGTVPLLEMFCVEDKKIKEIISFFDPRPILGS